jgi:4-aminobutyrate aminotransferase/(S)-3-amino-2-methylpropionate transaminase
MQIDQRSSTDEVLKARERYVPRGVSTTHFVVTRAWGARVWDADGREYLDFAGGIACQNLGHGAAGVTRAIHEQVDRYLHQCFMVGIYEPYVALAERLDEVWPGSRATTRSVVETPRGTNRSRAASTRSAEARSSTRIVREYLASTDEMQSKSAK